MRRLVVALVALASVGVVPALAQAPVQGPAPVRMEFDAVIKQAIDKNPTIARAVTNINRAETLLQQARAFTLPTLSTSITNATLDSARSFGSGTIQPRNQTVIGASAAVPVLAASRWAELQQARDQIVVAEASTAEVRQQIVVAAAQAYLAVTAAHRQVDVSTRSLESARTNSSASSANA